MYQIAGAYVSIGKYLNAHGRYQEALDTLSKALNCVNHHHMLYYHNEVDTLDKLYTFAEGDTTCLLYTSIGIDTPQDLEHAEEFLKNRS